MFIRHVCGANIDMVHTETEQCDYDCFGMKVDPILYRLVNE